MSELSTERPTLTVADGAWRIDPGASSAGFQHKTIWGLLTVRGTFPVVAGDGLVAEDGTAEGRVVFDAAALDTGHRKRDRHLRSADFFDVERHPTIEFAADDVRPLGATGAEVRGWLTARGVTRPVTFTAEATPIGDHGLTLAATVVFDRADFGMTWNQLGMIVGRAEVAVSLRLTRAA
jgi:polyisoprenoid-binding protein YceI